MLTFELIQGQKHPIRYNPDKGLPIVDRIVPVICNESASYYTAVQLSKTFVYFNWVAVLFRA